jgi:hypothetical protein
MRCDWLATSLGRNRLSANGVPDELVNIVTLLFPMYYGKETPLEKPPPNPECLVPWTNAVSNGYTVLRNRHAGVRMHDISRRVRRSPKGKISSGGIDARRPFGQEQHRRVRMGYPWPP